MGFNMPIDSAKRYECVLGNTLTIDGKAYEIVIRCDRDVDFKKLPENLVPQIENIVKQCIKNIQTTNKTPDKPFDPNKIVLLFHESPSSVTYFVTEKVNAIASKRFRMNQADEQETKPETMKLNNQELEKLFDFLHSRIVQVNSSQD